MLPPPTTMASSAPASTASSTCLAVTSRLWVHPAAILAGQALARELEDDADEPGFLLGFALAIGLFQAS